MAFGFSDQVLGIKEAIERCRFENKIIFLAAASSNKGLNSRIAFPAAYDNLVISIKSTNHLGKGSDFNPERDPRRESFATLGEDVPSAWPLALSSDSDMKTKSGTSTATCVATGLVACVLEFVRARVDTFEKTGRPRHHHWANIHTLEGMKAVLRLIAKGETDPYLIPWKLTDLGSNDRTILDAIRWRALRHV